MGIEELVQVKGIGNTLNKIIAENVPNLEKEIVIYIREAIRTPNRQDQKSTSPPSIVVKTSGIQSKERMKTAGKKQYVKGKLIKITADFSTETLKTRRAWNDEFVLKKFIIMLLFY
jgi:hypothetical protein